MLDSQLAEIVGRIYEAALDETSWSETLCGVADICGAANAALVVANSRLGYSSVVTPRADPDIVADYADMWWRHDPTASATNSAPVGHVTTLADTGRDLFLRSRFHNEFWRRSGLGSERIATNLIVGDGMFSSLVLQASSRRDEIGESMVSRFSIFVPHFVRAVDLARRFREIELIEARTGFTDRMGHVGSLVVDGTGRIIFADSGAEALLADDELFRTEGGVLRLARAGADNRLRAAIAACLGGGLQGPASGRIRIARPSGSPLLVEVLPFRGGRARKIAMGATLSTPGAMLVFQDPDTEREACIATLRQTYGLTSAEADLAVEMLKGDGRAAAARRCGISINTARTHLMRIFEKTGVSRQAELIRLLLDPRPV